MGKSVTVRLGDELHDSLRQEATRRNMTVSDLVRSLCEAHLAGSEVAVSPSAALEDRVSALERRLANDAEFSANTRLRLDRHLDEEHGIQPDYDEDHLD